MQEVILKTSQAVVQVPVVPTVSTSAYVAGYVVGGIQTLTGIVSPRGSGFLDSLLILDKSNQKAPFDILLFDSLPAGPYVDHTSFVWGGTDDQHLIARIAVASGDYDAPGGEAVAQYGALFIALQAASGFNIYAVAVTSGTPTYTSSSALRFVWGCQTS